MLRYLILLSLIPGAALAGQTVAAVNGSRITFAEADKRLWEAAGSQIIQQLIEEKLIEQEAVRLNLKVSDEEAAKRMGLPYDKTKKAAMRRRILAEKTVAALGNISVSDEEAKKFFDDNKAAFDIQPAVRLRQLMLRTKSEAQDMLIALDAGADFAALAEQKSADAATKGKGGDMGFVYMGQLVPETGKIVAALSPGQHSGVIETPAGFYILKLEERKAGSPADFEKSKDRVRELIMQLKIEQALPTVIGKLREKAVIKEEPLGKK